VNERDSFRIRKIKKESGLDESVMSGIKRFKWHYLDLNPGISLLASKYDISTFSG
jgi:hypothetical protein